MILDSNAIVEISNVVTEAGRLAELPQPVVRGFDGDGWRWVWSEAFDDGRRAEVHLRIIDDVVTEHFASEIQGIAWLLEDRSIARSIEPITVDSFAQMLEHFLDDLDLFKEAVAELLPILESTWDKVEHLSGLLESYEQQAVELEEQLDSIIEASLQNKRDIASSPNEY